MNMLITENGTPTYVILAGAVVIRQPEIPRPLRFRSGDSGDSQSMHQRSSSVLPLARE